MFKTNLTMFLMVFVMLFSATFANAQSVLWGTGHTNAQIDSIGEFASPDGTISGAGWTSTDLTAGTDWIWSSTGTSLGGFGAGSGVHITSPSLVNGVAMFDSDFFYDNGTVPQEAKLTSPAINLTGYADSLVVLKFYTGLRDFQSDSNIVRFSIDGGATWVSFDVITAVGHVSNGVASQGAVAFNVSSLLAGASNLSNCRIEFYFRGDSYFWSVDDVSIETFTPTFDLAVNEDAPSIITVGSAELPLAFVNDDETTWGANVKNTGFIDLAAASANLHMTVARRMTGSWTNVASDSIAVPAIAVGGAYFGFKSTIGAANWLPSDTGLYRVTYVIKSTVMQTNAANDTLITFFGISNNNYLSKVPLAADGYPFAENATLPAVDASSNLPVEHEFGSLFYIPTALTEIYAINQVKFRGAVSNVIPGVTSALVTAKVYKFEDSNADGFWTQAFSSSEPELSLLGLGVDTFSLSATTTYRTGEMVIRDIDTFGVGIVLQPNSFYFVSLFQSNSAGLRNATGQSRAAFIGFAENYYETTVDSMPGYYIPAAIFRDAHIDAASNLVDNTWYTGYSNGNAAVPSIGLVLERRFGTAVELVPATSGMEIFPNPASNQLTVKVSNEEALSFVQYIVTDITGRVIIMHTNKNVQNDVMTFDVSPLPNGVYFTTVRTSKGSTTQKFVKK